MTLQNDMSDLDSIRVLISVGQKNEAARQLARELSANPENLEAWLLMSQIIDDPARKADCFQQVLRIDPVNPQALAGLGKFTPPPSPPPPSTPSPSSPKLEPLSNALPTPTAEPPAGQTPMQDKKLVGDYLTAGSEPRPVGKESVPTYMREIQATPLVPVPEEPSHGSLFDAIDPAAAPPPNAPPPLLPGSYRDETPPPPPPWYKKPAARIVLTLLILALFGAAIFGGAKFMQASIPPTPTLQPTLTVEILPSKTPQDTWTPLPSPTPRPSLTPVPNLGSLQVALLHVNDLSLWRAGASSPLTKGVNLPISISPRGSEVIFTRVGDLWSVRVGDRVETKLMSVDDMYALQKVDGSDPRVPLRLGWLNPSGDLLFNTAFNPAAGGALRPADDLNKINLTTGKVTRLLPDGQGGEFFPSPDGNLIALSRPGSIALVEPSGENLRDIFIFDPILTPDLSPYYPKLAWTSDSSMVLLILPPKDAANDTAAATVIWRLPVDGSDPKRLAEINSNGGPVMISPDRTQVLYQLNIDVSSGAGELHSAYIDGTGDTIIQNGSPSLLIGWTLSSRSYTFSPSGGNSIQVGTLGQSGSQPLSATKLAYDPAFSPQWVNSSQFLLQNQEGIHLGFIGATTDLIAEGAPGTLFFDFTLKPADAQ